MHLNYIVNPKTNRKVLVNARKGRDIIKTILY